MFSKVIAVVLVLLFVHGDIAAQTSPPSPVQTPAKMQQVLRKAQEKNKAVKITLAKKIDKQSKLSGKASEISDTGFIVTDQKTGKVTKLDYQDVREVRQKGMSKGAKIALVVLAGVVIAAVIVGETITGGD